MPSSFEAVSGGVICRLAWSLKRLAAVVVLLSLLASCNQTSGTVVGPVIRVDGSLVEVTGFTVLSGGVELDFVPIEGRSYDFPLPHLQEHLRTGQVVVVEWEFRDDLRYALSISDG